ncbi:MAG: hypothetical protein ABI136_03725 [Ginsengibacter sp.]
MQDLITSFIIQAKECRLREVGKFNVADIAAKSDIANKQIIPPAIEINYSSREENISDGLVKYVADKKKISLAQAWDDLNNWCVDAKAKLINGEEILLEPLGVIKKGSTSNIFVPKISTINFFEPVIAERVIHQNSEHAILVGDRETTSSAMNNYFQEEEVVRKNNTWKILAIILFAIALFFLIVHFYGNSFSLSTIGNQHKIVPGTTPSTYTNP